MSKKVTREGWLEAAVVKLAPLFEGAGTKVPDGIRVSVGWPGGRGKKGNVIGQCWSTKAASDGSHQLFISPVLDDPGQVLATLVHELVQAIDDCESGHKGHFAKLARAVGLVGKLTATVAGEGLAETLEGIAAKLGPYPHAALSPMAGGGGKQSTRMLKLSAPSCCGYTVRTTRKWIDEGLPKCPHGIELKEDDE